MKFFLLIMLMLVLLQAPEPASAQTGSPIKPAQASKAGAELDAVSKTSSNSAEATKNTVVAEDAATTELPSPAAAAAKKAKPEAKPENNRKRPSPRDVFKPSEEISEDQPVPFPVDI